MKAYRNNGAPHRMRDGTIIKRGEIVNSDENLAEKFRNKFKEVAAEPQAVIAERPGKTKQKETQDKKPEEKKQSDSMEDVTEKFAEKFSVPDKYTIKRDKRGCWVFDGDTEPANEKPLKRNEVEAFIKECVG